MHTNSRLLFEKHAKDLFSAGSHVLEIGPDDFPSTYSNIVSDSSVDWSTSDITGDPRLTWSIQDEYILPMPMDSFDLVLSCQVIEHVRKPWVWLPELARVCKPGGYVITMCPASWPYHEAPVDCWRMFPEGIKALYEDSGLTVVLAVCESLEFVGTKRLIPGRSIESVPRFMQGVEWLLRHCGLIAECAYDTICIGRKEAG